ncbi:hypothetical protein DFS34DRAFT_116201 [Phlyctochytrium arcticum]|nr:hypothetical protein DFS34DRAFT_116201 [Phlyctochytrium arcticum]
MTTTSENIQPVHLFPNPTLSSHQQYSIVLFHYPSTLWERCKGRLELVVVYRLRPSASSTAYIPWRRIPGTYHFADVGRSRADASYTPCQSVSLGLARIQGGTLWVYFTGPAFPMNGILFYITFTFSNPNSSPEQQNEEATIAIYFTVMLYFHCRYDKRVFLEDCF